MPHTVYTTPLLKPKVVTLKKAEPKQEKPIHLWIILKIYSDKWLSIIIMFILLQSKLNYDLFVLYKLQVLYVGQTWAKEPGIQYVY